MLNVVQISGHHRGHAKGHRQSILEFDCYVSNQKNNNNNNEVLGKTATYASQESLRPDSASSGRGSRESDSGDEREYCILKALVNSGDKILVSDIRNILRTHRDAHLNAEELPHPAYRGGFGQNGCHNRHSTGRRRDSVEPKAALKSLSAVPVKICDLAMLEERQALLCWAYGELAYANEPLDRKELFQEVKEAHREIFEALKKSGESESSPRRLHFLLRFSQLCLNFAEWRDEEALAMIYEGLQKLKTNGRPRAASRASLGDNELRERRVRQLVDMIRYNVHSMENRRTLTGVSDHRDVMI